MVKIKGSLLLKKQIADIVSLIVLDFKEQFKNLDLESVKNDYHHIQYLMEQIEKKLEDKSLFDPKNLKDIDKNDLVIQIIKGIYPEISDLEIQVINNVISLIISNGLLEKTLVEKVKKNLSPIVKWIYPSKSTKD